MGSYKAGRGGSGRSGARGGIGRRRAPTFWCSAGKSGRSGGQRVRGRAQACALGRQLGTRMSAGTSTRRSRRGAQPETNADFPCPRSLRSPSIARCPPTSRSVPRSSWPRLPSRTGQSCRRNRRPPPKTPRPDPVLFLATARSPSGSASSRTRRSSTTVRSAPWTSGARPLRRRELRSLPPAPRSRPRLCSDALLRPGTTAKRRHWRRTKLNL